MPLTFWATHVLQWRKQREAKKRFGANLQNTSQFRLQAVSDGKLGFVVVAGADAVKAGAHAGNILREVAAVCGGKGGGRPDSAMGGGSDLSKIDAALAKAEELLKA